MWPQTAFGPLLKEVYMLECLAFILNLIVDFIKMLFDIDVGFTSLGTVMCVTFIFLPMVLTIVNFLKVVVIDELDEAHDFDRLSFFRYRGKHEYKPKHSNKRY